MAITHLLLAQKTQERGQNPKRKRERGAGESKQPAGSMATDIKVQALSPRMGSRMPIAK